MDRWERVSLFAIGATVLVLLLWGVGLAPGGAAQPPFITATPNPVVLDDPDTKGTTTITWDAGEDGARVFETVDNSVVGLPFSDQARGTKEARITLGHQFEFKLLNAARTRALATVLVTAARPAAVPPIAPPGVPAARAAFLYAVDTDGTLTWYRHDGAGSGAPNWQGPIPVSPHWTQYQQIFPGGGNVIYAVDFGGRPEPHRRLLWFRHNEFNTGGSVVGRPPHPGIWDGPTVVSEDWGDYKQLFSGSDGVIYAIAQDGTLKWFRHVGYQDGRAGPDAWQGPKDVGTGWGDFKRVFSGGNGVIYTISQDGTLQWRKHNGYLDGRGLESPGAWEGPKNVGSNWGAFAQVFSAGDGIVYAITGSGRLRWYKDPNYLVADGWPAGERVILTAARRFRPRVDIRARGPSFLGLAPGWQGPEEVGTGWNRFTTVFALLPRAPDVVR